MARRGRSSWRVTPACLSDRSPHTGKQFFTLQHPRRALSQRCHSMGHVLAIYGGGAAIWCGSSSSDGSCFMLVVFATTILIASLVSPQFFSFVCLELKNCAFSFVAFILHFFARDTATEILLSCLIDPQAPLPCSLAFFQSRRRSIGVFEPPNEA